MTGAKPPNDGGEAPLTGRSPPLTGAKPPLTDRTPAQEVRGVYLQVHFAPKAAGFMPIMPGRQDLLPAKSDWHVPCSFFTGETSASRKHVNMMERATHIPGMAAAALALWFLAPRAGAVTPADAWTRQTARDAGRLVSAGAVEAPANAAPFSRDTLHARIREQVVQMAGRSVRSAARSARHRLLHAQLETELIEWKADAQPAPPRDLESGAIAPSAQRTAEADGDTPTVQRSADVEPFIVQRTSRLAVSTMLDSAISTGSTGSAAPSDGDDVMVTPTVSRSPRPRPGRPPTNARRPGPDDAASIADKDDSSSANDTRRPGERPGYNAPSDPEGDTARAPSRRFSR